MALEQRLAESIRSFGLDALTGAVPSTSTPDVTLTVLAHTPCSAQRPRLQGRFLSTTGEMRGGAMDLVHGARRVLVLMEHNARDGSAKLFSSWTLPLTGKAVMQPPIPDLGVLDVDANCCRVVELAAQVSFEEIADVLERLSWPRRRSPSPRYLTHSPVRPSGSQARLRKGQPS